MAYHKTQLSTWQLYSNPTLRMDVMSLCVSCWQDYNVRAVASSHEYMYRTYEKAWGKRWCA